MKYMDRHKRYWSRMWLLQMCESPRKLGIADTQSDFYGRNRYRAALTRAQPPHWMAQRFHSNPKKNATLSSLCEMLHFKVFFKFLGTVCTSFALGLLSIATTNIPATSLLTVWLSTPHKSLPVQIFAEIEI